VARYVLTRPAERDLGEIWDFIARDDVRAADRVIEEIRKAILRLTEFPRMGRLRPDVSDQPLRSWPVFSYLIFYRPDSRPLEVVRIVSGFRELDDVI
jgi:plasmid stabilization system protein ParE